MHDCSLMINLSFATCIYIVHILTQGKSEIVDKIRKVQWKTPQYAQEAETMKLHSQMSNQGLVNVVICYKYVRREMILTALSIWCQTSGFF